MKLHEVGVIVFTKQFATMVQFYRDVLRLPVRAVRPEFCVFQWGNGYLMIEPFVAGHAVQPSTAASATCEPPPHVLRLNVFDIHESAAELRARGAALTVVEFEWGTVVTLRDPDGNVLELKNAPDFFGE